MHNRDVRHGSLRAREPARLREQHVRRGQVALHLAREGHGAQPAGRAVKLFQAALHLFVAAHHHEHRTRAAQSGEQRAAQGLHVFAAHAAHHDEVHFLPLRQGERAPRLPLVRVDAEPRVHGDARHADALLRHALFGQLALRPLQRQEIAREARIAEERDAGVIGEHTPARHGKRRVLPDGRHGLHAVEMGADDAVKAVLLDVGPQRPRVQRVGPIDRGGQARSVIQPTDPVHPAEGGRLVADHRVVERGNEFPGPLALEGNRVLLLAGHALLLQRSPHGARRAVVAFARAARQNQIFFHMVPIFSPETRFVFGAL